MSNFTKPLTGVIRPGLSLENLFEDLIFSAEEMYTEGKISQTQHAVFYSFIGACVPWFNENKLHILLCEAITSEKILSAFLEDAKMVNSPLIDCYFPFKTAVSVRDLLLISCMFMREIFGDDRTEKIFDSCCEDLDYGDFDADAFKSPVNLSLLTRDWMVRWASSILPKKERKGYVVK